MWLTDGRELWFYLTNNQETWGDVVIFLFLKNLLTMSKGCQLGCFLGYRRPLAKAEGGKTQHSREDKCQGKEVVHAVWIIASGFQVIG